MKTMRQLMESVSAIPGLGEHRDLNLESAPPGEEGLVKDLKKEYPGHEDKAFATAWSIYNKKHGKANESVPAIDSCNQSNPANADKACAMEENVEHSQNFVTAQQRMSDLLSSFVDPQEAFDIISREMDEQGIEDAEFDEIMTALENQFFPDSASNSDAGADAEALASAGHGSDEDYGDHPIEESGSTLTPEQIDKIMGLHTDSINTSDSPEEAKRWTIDHLITYGFIDNEQIPEVEELMATFDSPVAEDLQNGYHDVNFASGRDYFPDGADSPVVNAVGPSGARQGDNDEQKKMQVAETHKELVYSYRAFLKESARK